MVTAADSEFYFIEQRLPGTVRYKMSVGLKIKQSRSHACWKRKVGQTSRPSHDIVQKRVTSAHLGKTKKQGKWYALSGYHTR